MGWARLLFARTLFSPGEVAEENRVPQRLVVEGRYRYVRNPLYNTDFLLILGTALLTRSWSLILLSVFYAAQLALQLSLGGKELRQWFGSRYRYYCRLVPRFVPRRQPVMQKELVGRDLV